MVIHNTQMVYYEATRLYGALLRIQSIKVGEETLEGCVASPLYFILFNGKT